MKILWVLFAAISFGTADAADVRLNKSLNEEIIMVKNGSGLFGTELETTLFRPKGEGPFPLVVINHGKESGNPRFQARARYIVAAREFVRRGYVVMIPMRGGFSRSSGNYIQGGCNPAGNGVEQAKDVRAVLDYARTLPLVDRERVIVMGQSHGGLTTMAFGTESYPGVLGLVNFAGGLRLSGCAGWEGSLVRAFGSFGEKVPYPTLWFYGDNDSYWPKETVAEMFSAYTGAGGKARLVSFGTFKGDAHGMFGDRDGLSIWWPEVEKFLIELGLPTKVQPQEEADDPVSRKLREAGQAEFLSQNCRKLYQAFLDGDSPRAFATSEKGRCGYATGAEDLKRRAIDFCRGKTDQTCTLYVVDDEVVAGR